MSGIRIFRKGEKLPWSTKCLQDQLNILLPDLKQGLSVDMRTLCAALASDPAELFFAVNEEGDLVGYAELLVWNSATGAAGYVENVVVKRTYQKRGVGTELMTALLAKAQQRGLKTVHLHTGAWRTGAQALYKSLGFYRKDTTVLIKEF